MLGTSALTLVTLTSATAAPVIETGDFGDTFATRTILAGQGPVYGTLGGSDLFDYFQLSGFGAGQSIRIVLTRIAQLPEPSGSADPSASASASGSEEPSASGSSDPSAEASASGSEEPSASGSSDPSAEASASGSEEPSASGSSDPSAEASASGSEEPTASGSSDPSAEASASGSEEPTASASASGEPTDVGFTLHLLDETGAFDPLAGDSGPDASASADPFPGGQVFGDRSFAFDLDSSTLPTGDLNLRLAFDGTEDTFYQVTVTTNAASAISEPSSILPLAAGAAGLSFLAARRRRRKK